MNLCLVIIFLRDNLHVTSCHNYVAYKPLTKISILTPIIHVQTIKCMMTLLTNCTHCGPLFEGFGNPEVGVGDVTQWKSICHNDLFSLNWFDMSEWSNVMDWEVILTSFLCWTSVFIIAANQPLGYNTFNASISYYHFCVVVCLG